MRRAAGLFVMLALGLAAAGCGSSGPTTAGTPAAVAPGAPEAAAASSAPGGCPLSAADLSSATGMTFELATTEPDRALETLPAVKALVCVFTSAEKVQAGGDPLVLRVDTVTGADASTVSAEFERSCTSNAGTVGDSTVDDAQTCTSRGTTVEGNIDSGDRTVDVYFVNADNSTAAALTPTFDKVLDAVE
jgi:hypothetical protein